MVKENNSFTVQHTQRTTAGTKPKVYTPKQYTTTQSRNKKNNSTVNNSSTLNATPTETLDIDIKELCKSYSKLNLLVDNLIERIKILEEENTSMKLLLNDDEANVWQNCSRTIKIRDIPSTPNFISASKFSLLQQLQINDTQISHTSKIPLTTAPPSLQTSPKKSSKVSSPKYQPSSVPSTLTLQQRPTHSCQLQSPQQHEPATIPSIPQQPRPQSVPTQTISEYPPYPSAAQYCAPSSNMSFIVGDSHIKRVNKDMLKYHITNSNEKVYTKYFDGAKANEICHHILTTLHNDCPSRVIIHAGTNDVHENPWATDVAKRIIDIDNV